MHSSKTQIMLRLFFKTGDDAVVTGMVAFQMLLSLYRQRCCMFQLISARHCNA